jgi:hypothetical protein
VLGLERTLTSIANDRCLSRSHEAVMSTTEGRGRPRSNHSADAKKLRRYFIGGSDARIIVATDEAALIRFGAKRAARSSPRTCRAISSFSWAWQDAPDLVSPTAPAAKLERPTAIKKGQLNSGPEASTQQVPSGRKAVSNSSKPNCVSNSARETPFSVTPSGKRIN